MDQTLGSVNTGVWLSFAIVALVAVMEGCVAEVGSPENDALESSGAGKGDELRQYGTQSYGPSCPACYCPPVDAFTRGQSACTRFMRDNASELASWSAGALEAKVLFLSGASSRDFGRGDDVGGYANACAADMVQSFLDAHLTGSQSQTGPAVPPHWEAQEEGDD